MTLLINQQLLVFDRVVEHAWETRGGWIVRAGLNWDCLMDCLAHHMLTPRRDLQLHRQTHQSSMPYCGPRRVLHSAWRRCGIGRFALSWPGLAESAAQLERKNEDATWTRDSRYCSRMTDIGKNVLEWYLLYGATSCTMSYWWRDRQPILQRGARLHLPAGTKAQYQTRVKEL